MTARKAERFPLNRACEAAGVSTSAYYAWLDQPDDPTEAQQAEAELLAEIRAIHDAFDGTYGEPRMTAELLDAAGSSTTSASSALCATTASWGNRPRRRRSLTVPDEAAPPLADLVGSAVRP